MELPPYPDADDASGDQTTASKGTGTWVLIAIGAVVLVVVILHLTGVVGPAAH